MTAPDKTGLRCPDWDQVPATLAAGEEPLGGCGSADIEWAGDVDGVWDCLDCGLFFTTEAGTPPAA
jgi:hypothetical protein